MSNQAVVEDLASPALDAIARKCQHPQALLSVLGKNVELELKEHFGRRDSEGNKQGWWRSHFWHGIADKTHFVGATDREATITISSPEFLQKLHGGTITPKNGKMLAIPLTSEAKQKGAPRKWTARYKLPGQWNQSNALFVLKTASAVFLARKTGSGKEARGVEMLYLLKRSVTQSADARALPPKLFLDSMIEHEALRYLALEGGAR